MLEIEKMATSATSGPKLSSRSSSKREKNSSEETKQKSQRQTDNHNLKEIADAQFELEKMRSEKKRGMKAKQLNRYATAMYGTPQEKEELRYKGTTNKCFYYQQTELNCV